MKENDQVAELLILLLALPMRDVEPVGVLILNPVSDELFVKIKQVSNDVPPEVAEVFASLADYLEGEGKRVGGNQVLATLEANASMTLRVGARQRVTAHNFPAALAESYAKYISPRETQSQ